VVSNPRVGASEGLRINWVKLTEILRALTMQGSKKTLLQRTFYEYLGWAF